MVAVREAAGGEAKAAPAEGEQGEVAADSGAAEAVGWGVDSAQQAVEGLVGDWRAVERVAGTEAATAVRWAEAS